jgi:hypothetical protein
MRLTIVISPRGRGKSAKFPGEFKNKDQAFAWGRKQVAKMGGDPNDFNYFVYKTEDLEKGKKK